MQLPYGRHTVSGEAYPVEVQRSRIANGGWEYWLVVAGERVQLGAANPDLGLFTGPETTPAQIMPRLLHAAAREENYEHQEKSRC